MNEFIQYHSDLEDNGWPTLPVFHKRPSVWVGNHHVPMTDWTRFKDRHANDMELSIIAAAPEMGIGVPCGGSIGRVLGLDLDIDDLDAAYQTRRFVERELGETPFIRIGEPPKLLMVYRWAPCEDGIARTLPDTGALQKNPQNVQETQPHRP